MVSPAFGLAGVIIILGFLGNYFFKKRGIPDVLILIFLGFILGPLLRIINPSVLTPVSPIFVSLALLVILFDGGLHLNLRKVIQQSPRAFLLACLGVGISMMVTTLFTFFVWGLEVMEGILLGTIIGGTSSSIVIPLISRINIKEKIKALLSLESVFTDAIVVVLGITLIQIMTMPTGDEFFTAVRGIASAFSIGAMMGMIVGVVWLRVLRAIKGEIYDDILTLSIALLFYWIVENLGGNGAIFALSFGLVLGNGIEISKFFRVKEPIEASNVMKKFHSEISFFIRTFFFVYLGLIISLGDVFLILSSVILTLLLLLGRMVAAYLVTFNSKDLRKNVGTISFMFPRGLAAAIVAELVVMSGIESLVPLSEIVIIVIVSSVIISSLFTSFVHAGLNKKLLNIKAKKNKR